MEPQTFRSVIAVVVWWVWVLFAVGNLIDLAVQGRDHLSVVAAATLLMVTGIAYVTAMRPRVIAADEGITVQNPLRDHRIPWTLVSQVDLADLLRIHCRRPDKATGKIISAWAVHYSRRRQLTSDLRARRGGSRAARGAASTGLFGVPDTGYARSAARVPDSSPEAEAERIARLLNDRAAAAEAELQPAAESVSTESASAGPENAPARLVTTWSWPAIAALAGPALFLLIVALV